MGVHAAGKEIWMIAVAFIPVTTARPVATTHKHTDKHTDKHTGKHPKGATHGGNPLSYPFLNHGVSPQKWTAAEFRRVAERQLRPLDKHLFYDVTGTQVAELLDLIEQHEARNATLGLIEKITSNVKAFAHPLNSKGLHLLRALIMRQLVTALVREGLTNATTELRTIAERMISDGVIAFPHIDAALATGIENLLTAAQGYVPRAFGAVTGWQHVFQLSSRPTLPPKLQWTDYLHAETDSQFYMHVDTVQPLFKVFYFAKGTNISSGPFHYVNGSHANSAAKLRWLWDRSRMLTDSLITSKTVNATTKHRTGAYVDETHFGPGASFRLLGFDPESGSAGVAKAMQNYGFNMPAPMLAEHGITLVIADTSGLHYRGYAKPGALRRSASSHLPRKNPYLCMVPERPC